MSIYKHKPSGQWMFDFDRRVGGQRVRRRQLLPAGITRAEAEAFDRKESKALWSVTQGLTTPRRTIDDAVDCYLRERVPHLKQRENLKRELNATKDWWTGRAIEELPKACAEYSADQEKALKPATIRNRLRYLTAACRWAWKHHGISEHDPAARVVMPSVNNERQVYVDRGQMLRLARACGSWEVRAMIRIGFYSGMRLGEIQRAEVVDGAWLLRDTKNGSPRIVPMHPRCRAYSDYSWPKKGKVAYWITRAAKAAKLPDVTFHTLRHSSATAMLREGVPLFTVGAVLGHKSAASTKRYSHFATDSLTAAVRLIGMKRA